MQNETQILISIVTHNSKDIFLALDQLRKAIGKCQDYQVVVYDNASTIDYKNKLANYKDFITIVEGGENKGFGYGHNYNLLNTVSPYAIIFNPDVLVEKKALDNVIQLIQVHQECAIVVPKVLNEDGTIQYLVRNTLTVFDYMLRFIPSSFVKKLFNKRLARFECRDLSQTKDSYVRMGSGCFMAVRTSYFQQVHGFDERFFMYFEDNDLCMKCEKEGYKILYTPSTAIVHLYGKGAHRDFKMFRIFLTSMYRYFQKWGWQWF